MTYLNHNNEIISPIFGKIYIIEREGAKHFSLKGKITFKGVTANINRVTNKEITKPNRKWLEKNLQQTLWELSDFYKEIEKQKIELQKMEHIPTIREFGIQSLQMHKSNRKENTHKGMERMFNLYIDPFFGNRKINSIKPSELQQFQTDLFDKNLSGKYIKNIRSVFQKIMDDALNDKLIDVNPFKTVKQPKVLKSDIYPFSLDEIEQIINGLNERHKPMFILAFFTGMRWGEIIGLEWRHIDFEENQISIKQSIVNGILSDPKTNESNRIIHMLDIVKEHMLIQKAKQLHPKWVFVNQFKEVYYNTNSLNLRLFRPLLETLEIEYRPIRQTRHSFASLMLSKGEDILWVAQMLGHTDKSLTLNTYSKYIKQKDVKRATFLDSVSL